MLLGGTLVIALVDKTRLAGHAQPSPLSPAKLGLSGGLYSAPGYTGGSRKLLRLQGLVYHMADAPVRFLNGAGHYIVICGYDSDTDRFMIQDPASSTAEYDSVTTANLEAARHAYGTDEDLLLVTVPSQSIFGSTLVKF
jgi:hypothetical protein